MLAEIIIVSVVVMVALVSLFTFTIKMFIQYDKRIVYDNVDATYVARGLAENYIKDFIKNEFKDENTKYKRYNIESSNTLFISINIWKIWKG